MHKNLYEILIKFQEENGRGPDTLELLAMRKPVADHFGVLVRDVNEEADDWDIMLKRKNENRIRWDPAFALPKDDVEVSFDNEDFEDKVNPAEEVELAEVTVEPAESNKSAPLTSGNIWNKTRMC